MRRDLIYVANQMVIKGMLARWGFHRCNVVANGKEAVEAFSIHPYEIIFMDCNMPVMDGYEATKEIRTKEGGMQVPIIGSHLFMLVLFIQH